MRTRVTKRKLLAIRKAREDDVQKQARMEEWKRTTGRKLLQREKG